MVKFTTEKLPPADSIRDEELIIPDIDTIENIMRRESHAMDAESTWEPLPPPHHYNPPTWYFALLVVILMGTGLFLLVAP
jgi:hypothetical protein